MTKEEKAKYIDELVADLSGANVVYLTDTAGLTVETVNNLRRKCFNNNIRLKVVKNTLLAKAFERVEGKEYGALKDVLAGQTAVMFSEVGNAPAKLIQDFRKGNEKPLLKGAYIEEAVFVGDNQLSTLISIKSKEDLLVISLDYYNLQLKMLSLLLKGKVVKLLEYLKRSKKEHNIKFFVELILN